MSALTINGFPVPVSGWRQSIEEVGERGRSFSGKAWSSIRATKRRWIARITSSDPQEVEALRSLVAGEGFSWSFNADLYADGKGLPPISTAGTTLISAAPTPKFGAKCLRLDQNPATVYFQGDAGRALVWTVAYWTYESAAWHHNVASYDNGTWRKWRDGASVGSGYAMPLVSVNGSGQLVLAGQVGAYAYLDDLLWFPCLWPTTWPPILYARTTAFPAVPKLEVAGDLLPSTTMLYTCNGSVGESEATNRGSATSRLESLDLTLTEE